MPKIIVKVQTQNICSECEAIEEIDDDEWNQKTDEEKEYYCKQIMGDMIEWSWKIIG